MSLLQKKCFFLHLCDGGYMKRPCIQGAMLKDTTFGDIPHACVRFKKNC